MVNSGCRKAEIMNSKNILFPLEMLLKIVDLLSYWDTSPYDYSIQCDYVYVLNAIQDKLQAVELRNFYSKIVCAKDDDKRFKARMEYLKLRQGNRNNLPAL